MKRIIKALGGFGLTAMIFAIGYFILLYDDFTQLIVALGIVGLIILGALVYVYDWMNMKDEKDKETIEVTDRLKMYIREVEKKIE